ncbi:MAG: flagellar type III secretion system pore protein FliP [Verrucomicrobiota bacterium]
MLKCLKRHSTLGLRFSLGILSLVFFLILGDDLCAQASSSNSGPLTITLANNDGEEVGDLSMSLQLLIIFTILSVAPAILIMTTSFIRIIVVLSFLKSGLSVQQPPSQVLAGMAMFLTFFIMKPTWDEVYLVSVEPYQKGEITTMEALERAQEPLKEFMLLYTRETELSFFMDVAPSPLEAEDPRDLPLQVILPAFMLSELKTGFQMGLLILLPFLVVDMVIASTLMSLGMFMLPPPIIALPIKLMIFVLIDGWTVILTSLVNSFHLTG